MTESLGWLAEENETVRKRVADALDQAERNEFDFHWELLARPEQLAPSGDWNTWLILAGRGFGKTRAGAEWVRMIAERNGEARIALVSASLAEARAVMVEGESGVLASSPPDRQPVFEASTRRIRFANGAQAQLFSAAEPETLRGPQHSHAWCDEVGKWPTSHGRASKAWDNLAMGMRLGDDPRVVVTTTPRAVPLVQRLVAQESEGTTRISRGSTYSNAANLPKRFLDAIEREYSGSQLARQEIAGELLADVEGALWTRAAIEQARETFEPGDLVRVVVGVDPPVTAHGDECGILVAGLSQNGTAHVLADCSLPQAQPDQWAEVVANASAQWRADRVIAEANQGGAMVESVLRAAQSNLPIKLVHASRGKVARAEPIAALYASGRVHHAASFPKLEDQLCGLMTGGEYLGPGRSPDRADALIWALSELMLVRPAKPSVLTL